MSMVVTKHLVLRMIASFELDETSFIYRFIFLNRPTEILGTLNHGLYFITYKIIK